MKASSPRGRWLFPLVAGLLLALLLTASASADASWLDGTPPTWNQAGAAPPAAPRVTLDPYLQAHCTTRERPAAGPEETQLAAAGWRLETYWQPLRQGNLTVVMGQASYDGMCRPLQFNGFVFVANRFAGTISPVLMNSRTDGVLRAAVSLLPNGQLTASFTRYAPQDPLCCASGGATQVTYRVDQLAAGPVLLADQLAQRPNPSTLPPSGEPTPFGPPTALLGLAMIGLGWRLRRRSGEPSSHGRKAGA